MSKNAKEIEKEKTPKKKIFISPKISPNKSPIRSPKKNIIKSPPKSPIRSPKRVVINLDLDDKNKGMQSDKEDDLTIDNDDNSIIELEDDEEEANKNYDIKIIKQSIKHSIRKTKGKEIKDKDKEEKKIDNFLPINKIPGINDHLMIHINKRMNNILSKLKIPLINIDNYTFNRKLGEGSYGIIFSVTNNKDKKNMQ